MVEYIVTKSHANINNIVYSRGDKVELDDVLALHLLDQGVVIPAVDVVLPSEVDGLFAELRKENAELKGAIEKLKTEVARLTSDIELKNKVIAEYDSIQSRRKK